MKAAASRQPGNPHNAASSLVPNPSQPPRHPRALVEFFSHIWSSVPCKSQASAWPRLPELPRFPHPWTSPPLRYLVAERVALVPLLPQGGAHPQTPEPEADSTARPAAALQVPLAGLGETQRRWGGGGQCVCPQNPLGSSQEICSRVTGCKSCKGI